MSGRINFLTMKALENAITKSKWSDGHVLAELIFPPPNPLEIPEIKAFRGLSRFSFWGGRG